MSRHTLLLFALASGCLSSEDSVVGLGIIGRSPTVEAPSSVNAGSAFVVTITTWGGGCTSFARTEVELSETEVVVVPFDRTRIPGENEKCTQFLRPIPHPTTLVFELPGDKLIRIRGLDHERASEPLEVTRTIAVQ